MGKIRNPLPVKLFFGMLSPDPSLFETSTEILIREYGPLDFSSDVWQWDKTNYYQDEMGTAIFRKFIFFEHVIDPGLLPSIKTFTNGMERDFATMEGERIRRRINLDPGYVTEAKVVLATTKDFSHRLYIGSGLFAEVTLRYSLRDRMFLPLDYTYPDYKSEAYQKIFQKARRNLRTALHPGHPAISVVKK